MWRLSVTTFGAALVTLGSSLATTVIGTVVIGFVLAPLGTYYFLILDRSPGRGSGPKASHCTRAAGIIFASAVLTTVSLSSGLIVVTLTMLAVAVTVGFGPVGYTRGQR